MVDVIIYTKANCSYSTRAKEFLASRGINYREIDAGADLALRAEMTRRSGGRNTFPQIFIGDMHIGGYDDLCALASSANPGILSKESKR